MLRHSCTDSVGGDAENSEPARGSSLLTRKGPSALSADLRPSRQPAKPYAARHSPTVSTKSGRNYSVRGGCRHKAGPLQRALRTATAGSRSRPRRYRIDSRCVEAGSRLCSTNGIC
ncbi:hypothetical protein MTO96_005328 [Rhipicephalus appendiculatus]